MSQDVDDVYRCRVAGRLDKAVALVALLTCGCATTPYQYGRFHPQSPGGVQLQPIEVRYGQPRKTLDRIGYVLGTPARIITLNKKMNNHDISPETLEKLKIYMAVNDITDVCVAVNEYDPKGQWQRLRENKRVAAGWRYSVGTLNWLSYTILPNRLFGGDRYSPYTNTLNLSSDVPAQVLSAAAYAKDIHSQRLPGTYAAFVNDMPVLSVVREAKAARDVLGYARARHDWKSEQQAYHVLYPQIGGATVGTAGVFVPTVGPLLHLGGVAAGHAVGRTVAYIQRPKEEESAKDAPSEPEIKLLPAEAIANQKPIRLPPVGTAQGQNGAIR
ncbi:MAG TPA: hypothetical protein VG125_00770 [Pirellulales bacterium]|jgi:hypothetical protein|nr:hypothetical protein [Pirellulales bacterium]